jgi:hypothetical protein
VAKNLERGSDGLHLNPGLLTQANSSELKLVGVAPNFAWPRSWHDTSSLGESVYETGASSLVSCNVRLGRRRVRVGWPFWSQQEFLDAIGM